MRWGAPLAAAALFLIGAESASAELGYSLETRLRWEENRTPSARATSETDFGIGHLRLRLGVDWKRSRWSVHGMLQAAGTENLPRDGAFGAAPVYLAANRGDRSPENVGVAELNFAYESPQLQLVVGRQRYADGAETMTGIESLDAVKKRRLTERLIGNWDWVNVGRRFDGVSASGAVGGLRLAGFALRPLAGGVSYRGAFEPLDELSIYGASLSAPYGRWLPSGEARFFGIVYDDERPGAKAASGGAIEIVTVGTSLLVGDADQDALLWLAVQDGDWGTREHEAWAAIVEVGRRLGGDARDPVLRLGADQASGDGRERAHGGFFNLLPTNHKFYGAMDFSAFSNLRELYAELLWSRPVGVRIGVNRFELVERRDAWYGGSGAYEESSLGYAARRPASGSFRHSELGTELDIEVTFKLKHSLRLELGGGYFEGGAAAEEILSVDSTGSWAYVELGWKR